MQVTIYYSQEDQYLLKLVDQEARQERKSRSAGILSILEEHFEQKKRIGQILVDLGRVNAKKVEQALELQQKKNDSRPLGEILVDEGCVDSDSVSRALAIQDRFQKN